MDRRSPWHSGEISLQTAAGVAARMGEIGRHTIRDHLIEQHRQFFPLLPMVVIGGVDGAGDAWATLRAGAPGFLHAPDAQRLQLDIPRDPDDPAEAGLEDGAQAALLGIDLTTRRRNRLNGRVIRNEEGFSLAVEQSFGNCPKYIQRREPVFMGDPGKAADARPVEFDGLAGDARDLVARADTLFVATYVDGEGGRRAVDVSHRGGRPGFVRLEAGALVVPDYAGNLYFNTLGNILANPRAGLTFLDFETGDLLQMTGRAELEQAETGSEAPVTPLSWRFTPTRILWRRGAVSLRWRLVELSPHLPPASA
jgi:uncharacterized protein